MTDITGTSANDQIIGTSGNDVIHGLEGDDGIAGDPGYPALSGDDIIYGDEGNDYISGGGGNDVIYGGAGNDVITTGYTNDTHSTIYGGDGNDTIDPGNGFNTVYGDAGDDLIGGLFYNPFERLIVDGGAGTNTLWWNGGLNLATLSYQNIQNLQSSYTSSVSLTAAQFNGFQHISSLYDRLTVTVMGGGVLDARQADMGKFGGDFDLSSGLVKIDVSGRGFRGIADVPTLGYLSHTYNSERGVTTVYDPYGSGFSVNFIGGSPDNSVNFSGNFIGFTTITGNDIANVLNGTTADEFIYGLGGDDRLFGNDGNDLLDGGAGIDQLTGGNGQDVFKFSALTDSVQANGKMDRIADFVEGIDKIDLTGLGFLGVTSSTPNVGQLKVSYDSYYKQTYVRDLAGSGFGFYLTGNHLGLTNADFVGLVPPGQILTGTAANNILNGGAGNDLINGLGGDDRLFGNDGNDLLDGGAGIDQLTGGNGQDVFKFSALTDSVQANGKMDRIADFVEGIDKIDLTGLGFTGVTTGVPMSGQLKLSYDSYYKQTYVRDFSAGTGFGFYMTGNHTALANSSFIGFVNAIAGMAAPSVTTNSIKDPTQPDFIIAANLM